MISYYIFLILASKNICDPIETRQKKGEEISLVKKRQFFRTDSIKEAYDNIKNKFNNIKRKRTTSLQIENIHYQDATIENNEQLKVNAESAEYEEIITKPTNIEKSKRFSEQIDMSKRKLPEIPVEEDSMYMEMVYNPIYENIDLYQEVGNRCWYYKYTNNIIETPKFYKSNEITSTHDGYCTMTIREIKLIELSKKILNRLDDLNKKYTKQIESQQKRNFLIDVIKMIKFEYKIIETGYGIHKNSVYVALMYEDILRRLDEVEKWEIYGCNCKEKCDNFFE